MKKIKVLTDSCIGCGICVGIDSEHFTFNEDGFSIVKSEENLDSENLKDAIESCPVGIISIEESNCSCGEECNCGDDCHCNDSCSCHQE